MSKIKSIIKKMPIIGNILINIKNKIEFKKDFKFFQKNYIYNSNNRTKENIEYALLLEVHKLEKGMACKELRPFGINKIEKIISLITEYKNITGEKSFAYNISMSILNEYKNIYESKKWIYTKEYSLVSNFLNYNYSYDKIDAGAFNLHFNDIKVDFNIDYNKFINSRHSIRNFAKKKLKKEDIQNAVNMAIKSPTACNRQMCKIYNVETNDNKKIIEKYAQGLGLFEMDNINYFVITFDVAANYFVGERNQGWFNSGLFSMNFVNALHSLGIGSCFIQFGNSFKEEMLLKEKLELPKSERIAVIIAAGYYDKVSRIPYSSRKSIKDIYFKR